MALSIDIINTTLDYFLKDAGDLLMRRVPFLDWAKRQGKILEVSGGANIRAPIITSDHTDVTGHPTGYEPLSTVVRDVTQAASYELGMLAAPIRIAKKELAHNQGEQAQVNIVEARTTRTLNQLRTALEQHVLAGSVAAATSAGIGHLNGVVLTDGYLEDALPGAQANTVGGISKATLTAPGWQNQWQDIGGSFSTNGEPAMIALSTAIRDLSPDGMGPHLVVASQAGHNNLRRFLAQRERYIDSKALEETGRYVLFWDGVPVEASSYMPTNTGVGTDEVSFYFLNFEGLRPTFHKDGVFQKEGPLALVPGYLVYETSISLMFQLVADNLGAQGIATRGDTY